MTAIPPERQARLVAKYGIHSGPGYGVQQVTPRHAVATAWAEQVERTIREVRDACAGYNGDDLEWLDWELPRALRARVERERARLHEAQSRDGRGGGSILHYYDDRNKRDNEAHNPFNAGAAWPDYEPGKPGHATVPLGHILADPNTVHVLRGGTQPLFDRRDGLGRHERPSERAQPQDGLPDYGHAYDFPTFMRTAERTYTFGFCDLRLPGGCGSSVHGLTPKHRLLVVPLGQNIYVLATCAGCLDALAQSWRRDHRRGQGRHCAEERPAEALGGPL